MKRTASVRSVRGHCSDQIYPAGKNAQPYESQTNNLPFNELMLRTPTAALGY